jgi:mono/diheme cytochrome c family protein
MGSHPAAPVLMRIATSIILIAGIAASSLAGAGAQQKSLAPEKIDIDGETMFATSCGFCHQSGGRADGRGPKLAGTKRSDDFIAERVRKGKPGAMPAYGSVFSESQIMAIVAYIRTLEE